MQLYHLDGKPMTNPADGVVTGAVDWADRRRMRRLPDARSQLQSLYLRRLFLAVESQSVTVGPLVFDGIGASAGVTDGDVEDEDEGDAGDTGSVMSLLLLQDDASEHVSDATPLFQQNK